MHFCLSVPLNCLSTCQSLKYEVLDHIRSCTVGFITEFFISPISGAHVKALHVKVVKKQQISDRGKFGG